MPVLSEKRHLVALMAAILTLSTGGLLVGTPATTHTPPRTVLASRSTGGALGNGSSAEASLSADGRYIAFSSNASNLVAGDTFGVADIFVRDLRTGVTRRVSVGAGGAQANGRSNQPRISGDGRYVAFASDATNLVAGDTNHQPDVFVRDLRTGTTRLVSVGVHGAGADGDNAAPSISATGRYIAFISGASNLVHGDTDGTSDIFVRDMVAGTTQRVSVRTGGGQADAPSDGPSISGDGRYIAFASTADNLVTGDTNGVTDVFLRDRVAHTTRRVSVGPGGVQADGPSTQPAISADGTRVAYVSEADNLVATDTDTAADVLVRTLATGVNIQVSFRTDSLPGSFASEPSISAHGDLVAFTTSSDLVAADTNGSQDVYLRDVPAGTNELISVDLSGGGAGLDSAGPAIAACGNRVAFTSSAATIVPGDGNNRQDVFVRLR
jgi:Tol biopolymer transport system component